MKWNEYVDFIDEILSSKSKTAPYDSGDFLNYAKLNITRIKRWLKKGVITDEAFEIISSIDEKQNWILITEPWCGDASQISPFIVLLSNLNPFVNLEIQLRDSEGSEIEKYLTNNSKAIPKLIVRDEFGNDLFVWGPRTENCQQEFLNLKKTELSEADQKAKLQEWYNNDSGVSFQTEFTQILKQKTNELKKLA